MGISANLPWGQGLDVTSAAGLPGSSRRFGDRAEKPRPDRVCLSGRRTNRSFLMADKVYSDEEVQAKLAGLGLAEWYLEDGWLRRKYTTDGWPTTLMLTNAVGYICEAAWHHADL